MYDYFQGAITYLSPTQITVDCQGVGYRLDISLYTFSAIKELKQVKLYAHQVIREDAHLLFGFFDEDERFMFRELLNVSGVGASTSRIILSSMNPHELRQVIAVGDIATLQRVKGIGAKTAQRIVVDLQDRMKKGITSPGVATTGLHNTSVSEALSALLTLGFGRPPAEKALLQAQKNLGVSPSVEELIKIALSYL